MTLPAPPPDIAAAKKALRIAMKGVRAGLSANIRAAAAQGLAAHADALCAELPAGVAAAYLPIRGEADPLPLLMALVARGWAGALPRVEAEDMTFRRFAPGDALETGAFGLGQPGGGAPEVAPTLVLVPLLAFDAAGNRLGYGRGYYDRALARLPGALAVGVAYGAQAVARVPAEPHDRRLAMVVTEAGLIDCRPGFRD